MIITIDGPAGSGKSTAARQLAKALGIAYLDTGATYRAITYKALSEGVDLADRDALAALARRSEIQLIPGPEKTGVILDGRDVTAEIRREEVSQSSHYVADPPQVRDMLVALQRRIGAELGDFVSEGRDQGSVVFPQADVKFYLDADAEVRARRRQGELLEGGQDLRCEEVLGDIRDRDRRDRSRSVAPLVKPDGAIVVDTSNNTIEQTAAQLVAHIRGRR